MPGPGKRLCPLLVLGLLVAPALSGCASSSEPTLASAVAHSSVAAGLVGSIKDAEDKAEVKTMTEAQPQSPQEREEMHEMREQIEIEASQASGGEGEDPSDGETDGEAEGEEG